MGKKNVVHIHSGILQGLLNIICHEWTWVAYMGQARLTSTSPTWYNILMGDQTELRLRSAWQVSGEWESRGSMVQGLEAVEKRDERASATFSPENLPLLLPEVC